MYILHTCTAQQCTTTTRTSTTYLLDVELLLCVAEWINQSKQTTGRRETPKTSLTITYYVKYNKHFWRRQLQDQYLFRIHHIPTGHFWEFLTVAAITHWFQSRNVGRSDLSRLLEPSMTMIWKEKDFLSTNDHTVTGAVVYLWIINHHVSKNGN